MNERLCLKPKEDAPLVGVSDRLGLKPKDVARLLGVCPPVVYDLCRRPDFPAIRIGRSIVIPVDQLREWLAQQSAAPRE